MLQGCRATFWRGSALAASLLLVSERAALAEGELEPIVLSYRAPESCPSFEQFVAEIQRSSSRLRLARADETARHFEVVIEPSGNQGHLTLAGGTAGEREASGADCRAVAELLAFAVALAADPDAQPPGTTGAVATFPPVKDEPSAGAEPPLDPSSAPPAVESRVSVERPLSDNRWQWGLAGVGFATGASAPAITWGGGASVELGLNSVALSPRLRLGASYAKKTLEVTAPSGSVALTSTFLTLEGCSAALRRGALTFLPCLRVHGGARNAQGQAPLPGHREVLRGFLDLGAAAHLRWRFAGPVFVEGGAALMFATIQDQIKILPGTPVYDVPAFGALGEVALGVEFGDQNGD